MPGSALISSVCVHDGGLFLGKLLIMPEFCTTNDELETTQRGLVINYFCAGPENGSLGFNPKPRKDLIWLRYDFSVNFYLKHEIS